MFDAVVDDDDDDDDDDDEIAPHSQSTPFNGPSNLIIHPQAPPLPYPTEPTNRLVSLCPAYPPNPMGNEHRGLGPVCHPPGQYQFQSSPSIPSPPNPTITSRGPRPGRPVPGRRRTPC
ncbi:hypothetical protein LX32DRAFT_633368 [Colletotrichum zoysiae]|uniref:Uncharacterized protein n=1 Tax=Colletotrichum zoysiae TaxID=1216348 RepID=A0AAD9HUQ8_9PEZI|nr:hypothetical protein LX32DRAFT_633368 [Colletotrichum zoysiae]